MPDSQTIVISTRNLTRKFRNTTAVDHLDFSVYQGEIFGLIGPDGAGKTTTIRMLAAILLQSAGRASVLGYDTLKAPEAIKTQIGYMAQRFNLYRDLTVWENLSFFADIFGIPHAERLGRFQRLLEFARLERFKERRADHLSGGMQKKLALACTLIHQPRLLFLDEPTTGVDPVSRREFWEILTDLHLQGVTIFISTPYMDEAERCSRVGLLYHGRLIALDTPDQIRQGLPGDLLQIEADDLRLARQAVASLDGVLEVQTYGDQLHVFVRDAQSQQVAISTALQQAGVKVSSIQPARPHMEEAFIALIRRQEAG